MARQSKMTQGDILRSLDNGAERRLTVTLDQLEHRVSSDMPRNIETRRTDLVVGARDPLTDVRQADAIAR
jgi:hypothetical protein